MMVSLRALIIAISLAVTCGAAHAEAGPIPFKQDPAAGTGGVPGGALAVLLLSAVAIIAVVLVRKRFNLRLLPGGAPGVRHVRVLETQRLGPRSSLSVVEFAGTRYLLAQSEQGIVCLANAAATGSNADQLPLQTAVTAVGEPA